MYFNLIVSGNETWWDSEFCRFGLDRLFEYSDETAMSWLSPISADVNLRELESYPTVLAYESGIQKPARLVHLKDLRIAGKELLFRIEDRKDFHPVPSIYNEELRFRLRIDFDFEIHRTHWAVKSGDLLEILGAFRVGKREALTESEGSPRVFVVHGHDEATLQLVARFLERIGLTPIILKEQPDGGKTIIEKFEHHAELASFAVVLLTPDDFGGSKQLGVSNDRARQNVILELGYFVGALKRSRVCALKKGSIDLPSDIFGVLWKEIDPANGWMLELAKGLKHAGLSVDLTKLL